MTVLQQLHTRLAEISDLNHVSSLVGWDQQTYMPPGGSVARAEHSATLQKIIHEMFIADETGRLLDAAAREVNGHGPDSDEARLIRVTRRDYEKLRKIPAELVAEIARVTGQAVDVWTEARAASDWKPFSPYLARIFEPFARGAGAPAAHAADGTVGRRRSRTRGFARRRVSNGSKGECRAVESPVEHPVDRRVEEAFARLAVVDERPVEEHADVYDEVHRLLQGGLGDLAHPPR